MLGGLSPVFIFTFFKTSTLPTGFVGPVQPVKIPLVPIPIYLDEGLTGIMLDDYSRTISIDIMRDGVTSFEKVSGDVVNFKFRANKNNIPVTALTALFNQILQTFSKKIQQPGSPDYTLTVFYDNIFLLDCSLEQIQTTLADGTDMREISIQLANRPKEASNAILARFPQAGTAAGITI